MTSRDHGRARPGRIAPLALLGACLLPLVWPGDAPFINDEPLLIASAVHANAASRLADIGLNGTFGVAYGPLATWIYQLLTAITHNLVVVTALRTGLMVAVTAAALWWLARSLDLPLWFAPVPLVSPYFWFYARVLWDNPFLIPLSALALAGYAAHLASGSSTGLRLSLAAAAGMLLVHLMSVAFVVPLIGHMVLVRRRELWAHRISLLVTAVVILALAGPYVTYLLRASVPAAGSARLQGWLFPLWGGLLLSARDLDYFFGREPVSGAALHATTGLSALAFAMVWIGIALSVRRVGAAIGHRQWTVRAHVAVTLLGMLVCQSALDGFSGKFEHPQYYNATWIAFVLFAWFAVDALASSSKTRWLALTATGVLAAALLVSVVTVALRVHRAGGTRTVYGATLANQQRVARVLATYALRSEVTISVPHYLLYPHALTLLRELNTPRYRSGPEVALEVRFASADPASGAIELVER